MLYIMQQVYRLGRRKNARWTILVRKMESHVRSRVKSGGSYRQLKVEMVEMEEETELEVVVVHGYTSSTPRVLVRCVRRVYVVEITCECVCVLGVRWERQTEYPTTTSCQKGFVISICFRIRKNPAVCVCGRENGEKNILRPTLEYL